MPVSGGTQYVRVGGQGSALLLLHGFGDTGDMWAPLAEPLVKDDTVIVPDLRGMGLSSHPEAGYEKTAQIPPVSMSKLAIITPHFMLAPAPSTTHSADSSPHSPRMRSTTKNYLPRASCRCRSWPLAVIIPMASRLATEIAFAAANVHGAVTSDSGHWIMEEQPERAIALILSFVDSE
jgi:pimeloyl-ACP methyl ester carboxylesterase